jgi:hypothetical protein
MRLYRYVGPRRIAERVCPGALGTAITSPRDVAAWARSTDQGQDAEGCLIVTFVVDGAGVLRIADRRSEHVACAAGGPVQSAGEITFALEGGRVAVAAVSNQSTGYCPEPDSWPAVAAALRRVELEAPEGFALACAFRRCLRCDSICLVKAGVFVCDVCGAELPAGYNCQEG